MRTEIIDMTPQYAKSLLDANPRNRSLSKKLVTKYADDMSNHAWDDNGSSIKVSPSGDLLDGQHRLSACVRANMPFRTVICYDVDPKTLLTMDTGRKRTLGDYLKINGYKNYTTLSATAGRVYVYRTLGLPAMFSIGSATGTNKELLGIIEDDERVAKAAAFASARQAGTRSLGIRTTMVANLYYAFADHGWSDDDIKGFFTLLLKLGSCDSTSPITACQTALIRIKDRFEGKSAGRPTKQQAALIIKAWNKWQRGEECKLLTFTAGGAHPETFPEPVTPDEVLF